MEFALGVTHVNGRGTSIGALVTALLGALGVTSEISTGTIRPTLLATPNRTVVIAARLGPARSLAC